MKKNCCIAVIIMAMIVIGSCSDPKYKLNDNLQINEIGIPVKSVNWVRLHEGKNRDGQPCILTTMGQTAHFVYKPIAVYELLSDFFIADFRYYSVDERKLANITRFVENL